MTGGEEIIPSSGLRAKRAGFYAAVPHIVRHNHTLRCGLVVDQFERGRHSPLAEQAIGLG